ncbi:Calnexin [Clonorchis sinensis]|uniref:Calnexin n=2 Tax=Clonorchis sinensis TaxID=79923 RepID=A0A8T1MUD4_CLOSI|nr:Calnexin [Clonorchis sinensis]
MSLRVTLVLVVLVAYCFALSLCEEVEAPPKPKFQAPNVPRDAYFAMYFESPGDMNKFVRSVATKDGAPESLAKYDGVWSIEEFHAVDGDYELLARSKAKHHAISAKLSRPIKFDTDELVVQYEVRFAGGIDCAGAYIKLLSDTPGSDLAKFNDKTLYTIMFGPDKCDPNPKFHFIIQYKNPKTGQFEEKHAKKVTSDLDQYFTDKKTHLYTLVMRSDNSFERYIDQVKVQSGNLLNDLEPQINPPEEIDDPNDKRPDDWDDRETIVDVNAKKPDDWDEDAPEFITDESATKPEGWLDDEPEMIPDPNAEVPKDWDPEMDGEWEAPKIKNEKCSQAPGCGEWRKPQIRNPAYKGKWSPPLIANPAFKGIWKPAKIKNPDYYYDNSPFKNLQPVSAIGIELWTMNENITFDNFLIVDSWRDAYEFAQETWARKAEAERRADPKAQSVIDAIRDTYKEKPFLVIGIGIACTIPLLLCLWFICRPSKRHTPVAMHKKTDAATPDDVRRDPTKYDSTRPVKPTSTEAEEAEEEDEEEEDVEDEEEDDLVQVPNVAGGDASATKTVAGSKADLESDSESADVAENEPAPVEKHSVRKRRSRKE